MLRNIFGPVSVGDDYRIRTNRELYELFNAMHVAKRINNQRFRWFGHVVRLDADSPPRRVFDAVVGGGSFKAGGNPIIGLLWPHK